MVDRSGCLKLLPVLAAILACACHLPADANAQTRRVPVRVGVEAAFSECYCRAGGRRYEVGEQACIRTPGSARLAACRMEQNVTSWRMTETPCPDS